MGASARLTVWLKLAVAVLASFVFTQIGYIGHDAGHRQIFARPWRNDVLGLGVGLLLGVSRSWWVESHNDHHSFPNDLALDPHTAIPTLAFSEDQARAKTGIMRQVTRFQAFYFFPMLLLQDNGFVYWVDDTGLHAIPKAGGTPIDLAEFVLLSPSGREVHDIALSEDYVVWAGASGLKRVRK